MAFTTWSSDWLFEINPWKPAVKLARIFVRVSVAEITAHRVEEEESEALLSDSNN